LGGISINSSRTADHDGYASMSRQRRYHEGDAGIEGHRCPVIAFLGRSPDLRATREKQARTG
jgi:hypothetical protein